MNAVAMAGMLRQQDGIITADGDNDARCDLRVVTFTAVAAEQRPFGFARVHGVAAVTAVFMRAVKLRQLYAAPRQLEQADVQIQHLTYGSHILTARLLDQPHGIALPLADLQCGLAHQIERFRGTVGQLS